MTSMTYVQLPNCFRRMQLVKSTAFEISFCYPDRAVAGGWIWTRPIAAFKMQYFDENYQ